jgi:hypothetical protein
MTQDPHGPPDPGPARGPGTGPPPGRRGAPGSTGVRTNAPVTGALRLLLGLTLLSFGLSVLDSLAETFTGPPTLPVLDGMAAIPGVPGGEPAVVVMLLGQVVTAALYALVWFGLRDRRQWAWALGLVFCSLAVLGDVFNLAVYLLGGHLTPALSTSGLIVVNAAWLVVAARPGVRAALR